MRYPTMWQQAAAPGGRTGVVAVLLSAAMLLPVPAARAADQPSPAGETPPAVSGPLTPVHRDLPTAAERPAAKAPAAAKPPTETPRAAAAAPTAPSPAKPEVSTPRPPRNTAASAPAKPAAPTSTQAEKKPAPVSAQSEKKPAPAERTAEPERRHRHVAPEMAQRPTRVYRDYAYQQPGWGYAPSPGYEEAPAEIAPAPYAPSWYYRERPFADGPYAYGPYSGMRGPRPMPW